MKFLLYRFLFCRAVLTLHAPTFNKKEFIPKCVPSLPASLLPSTVTCQTIIMQIANIFGATDSFIISEQLVPPENIHGGDADSMSSS